MTEQGPYDDLVGRLHTLRAAAGMPSFGDLALRVSRLRRERGLTPERARVGRTTVYDAFRMGRQRIDADLVGDIARALGADEQSAQAWTEEAQQVRRPRTFAPSAPPVGPEHVGPDQVGPDPVAPVHPVDPAADSRPITARLVVGVVVACLAVNLLGRVLVDTLGLPVYLDMVGTAFSAVLLGPWWGALVGGLTNVAGVSVSGSDSLLFAPVNIVGALLWGYGVRGGLARTIPRFFGLNLVVALVCSCVAVPTIVVLEQGFAGHGADRITLSAMVLLSSVWASVTVANLLTSVVDKLICGFVSLAVLESLPAPLRPPGWLSGPSGPEIAVRACSDLPGPGVEGPRPVAG
jgi:energy-coupling factor transport system substrate-specific component